MLSVGNRDGRKGLGFGGDMDDTELEEGEACSYLDDDPTVDPDIALAYLDEKLQSVLGHFQKDFEGGVSAENLGAKFGGYGSFLPTYQRSPVCSHPRTPKVQNHALRSPSNFQFEGGFHNITTAASASLPAHSADISNTRTLSSTKPLKTHDPVKLNADMEHSRAEELTSGAENFKKSKVPDQKKLRVRIRVGSDKLSSQTKAELYSGLGLVASPSSSFEDSPESEGWSREPHDAPDESPTHILHIMSSFPLEGSMLLSPLAEDLAYLTGDKKSQRRRRPDSVSKSETEKSVNLVSGPGSSGKKGKLSVAKNKKPSIINDTPLELSNGGTKNVPDIGSNSLKEADDEASACEKLISKALKLPLLSTLDWTATDFPDNGKASEVFMAANKAAISSQLRNVAPSDRVGNHVDVANGKPTAEVGSVENQWEDLTENLEEDNEAQPNKYLIHKGGKNYESSCGEFHPSNVVKTEKQEIITYPTAKTDVKVGYQEPDGWKIAKDHSSSKAKSKLKAKLGHGIVAEVVKGKARDEPSFQSKLEKNINRGSKYANSKVLNDVRKSRESYKDIFRDLSLERDDKEVESLECTSGPGKTTMINTMKEESSSKNIEKLTTSESHKKTGSHAAPLVSYLVPDAPPPAPAPPLLIEEHWVCCDKCQKWRLLPAGKLPDSLPEKWLCSMLDWLPDMNRCDIEEDETTKALVSFCQASVPESDKNPVGHNGGSTTGAILSGIQHPNSGFNSVASVANKRNGLTEMSIAAGSQGPTDMGVWTKNLQPAVKSRSLNDVNQCPSVTNMDNPLLKKSRDIVVKKNKKLSKDGQKLHDPSSDRGDSRNAKTNKKRRSSQDSPKASKKHKSEDPTDDRWLFETDRHLPSKNGGPNSRSMSPYIVTGKDYSKSTDAIPYKNHVGEDIDTSKTSSKKLEDQVLHSVDGSFGKRKANTKDSSAKKRKAKGSQESRHSDSLLTAGFKAERKQGSLMEKSSQRDHSKERKARPSSQMSDSNRESNTERGDRAIPKDVKLAPEPDNVSFKWSAEDMDPSRRDLAPTHSFMEATSSSSKISSSRKSKANFQDTTGSPVESVSSSPLRSRNKYRHASNGRHAFDKECPPNDFGLSVSPLKHSDHEVDGRNAVGLVKKDNGMMEKASVVSHKATKYSSVLDFRNSDSGGKSKVKSAACDEFPDVHTLNEVVNASDQYPCEEQVPDFRTHEEAYNNTHSLLNGSLPDKKGLSLRSKERMSTSKSGFDKSDASNFFDSSKDLVHAHGDKLLGDKASEHTAAKHQKSENKHDMKVQSENGKNDTRVKSGSDDLQDAKNAIFPSLYPCRQSSMQEQEGTSNTLPPKKMDLLETSLLRGKSVVRSPSVGGISTENCHTRHTPGSHKLNEIDNKSIDASGQDKSLKGLKPLRKADNQNGAPSTTSRYPTPVGHTAKDPNAPSPARRDSSSQSAANAIKEATSLKHAADRMKSSGSNAERIGFYFQAALKFLLGASLLESSASETRLGDMIQSTQMYSSTAKLCEFCAHEFEKAHDMTSAALAYKCTEVAYMRVIYSSHSNANRDRHELQTALQMAPPGESPSSSASDVENLNNTANGDKVLPKGVSSPQVAGSHVISARNRPGFARLLNFAQDVSFAMEASKKSRAALAVANGHLKQFHNEDGISIIKRALDYNFHDVEGLLQLVRLGMDAIGR
ncbi:unnamed protein product [Rhodiola kirilowii]